MFWVLPTLTILLEHPQITSINTTYGWPKGVSKRFEAEKAIRWHFKEVCNLQAQAATVPLAQTFTDLPCPSTGVELASLQQTPVGFPSSRPPTPTIQMQIIKKRKQDTQNSDKLLP